MKRSEHPCLREGKKCAAKLLSEEQNADETLIRTRRTQVTLSVSHTHKTRLLAVDEICTQDYTLRYG
jgi:hypothetical protein